MQKDEVKLLNMNTKEKNFTKKEIYEFEQSKDRSI